MANHSRKPTPSTQAVQAPDLARAFDLIRARYGDDALIQETRRIEGPAGDEWVEVVLAVDDPVRAVDDPASDAAWSRLLARVEALAADIEALEGEPDPYPLAAELRDVGCGEVALEELARDFARISERGSRGRTAAHRHLATRVRALGPRAVAQLTGEHWIVGRAGSGKTTATLLLAAHLKGHGLHPVVVTLAPQHAGEVQRVAAAARALDVAAASAYDAGDLARHRDHFADRDVLLVDAPCRLDPSAPAPPGFARTHLVTPLGEDPRQLRRVWDAGPAADHLLVTQADLCDAPGRLVELATVAAVPVTAIAGRQDGTPRLRIPTTRDLLAWVLPEPEPAHQTAEA